MLRGVVEKSEKLAVTGNYTQGSWLEPSVLCHRAMTTEHPPAFIILYTGGTDCLSCTPSRHPTSTVLGVS